MTKHFLLVPLLSLLLTPSFAQNGSDYERFVNDAGELSNIYRGQSPLVYNFRHTGTYYAYSENFEIGVVKYNGKIYKDVYLNLNSHLDELNILIKKTGRTVVLNNDFVGYFSFGGRDFIYLKDVNKSSGSVPQIGYYQVLYNGSSKLYKKIKKIYAERINETASIQTKSKLERMFLVSESYYLLKEGSFHLIKKKSDLLSYYKEKKRDIRQLIREKNLDFRRDKDHSFSEIIRFVESGTTKSDE